MPEQRRRPKTKVGRQLLQDVRELDEEARELGVPEESLLLAIDRKLDERVVAGTNFADRFTQLNRSLAAEVVLQLDRSLVAQETYEEFEGRMLDALGVEEVEPAGALAKLDAYFYGEAKLAYNEAMQEANRQEETVTVWRAQLDNVTTPGCWARHGLRIEEDLGGEVPPRHPRCRCDVLTIPDPESEDEEWAALGQETLDEMEAERREGSEPGDLRSEALRPLRLWRLESRDQEHAWMRVTDGARPSRLWRLREGE